MHVSNRKKLLNGVHSRSSLARSITYQSRMSYLKSREGDSSGRRLLGKRIIGEKPSPSFTLGAPLKPCQPDKLLPPMQLMTKEKSFRHLYRKHHPPAQICKMNFLKKKEDPNMKRLKDEIYAKIRASDLASEQLDRDKEAWQSNRNEKVKISCEIVATNASSELSGNEENQNRSHAENEPERSRDHGSGFAVSSNSATAGLIARNEEIEIYGDRFSFLAEWKKETKRFHKQDE